MISNLALITRQLLAEVTPGTQLSKLIMESFELRPYDVIAVTQKIVSKAENRVVALDPDSDDQFEALVEQESRRVLRRRGKLMITETKHGFICANAGVDRSNTDNGTVTLLPKNPDHSAFRIREELKQMTGFEVAVLITDTFGRTFRSGVTDVAIGSSGLRPIVDLRGTLDQNGKELQATEICIADEIAGACDLVKTKDGRTPVVVVRGLSRDYFGEGTIVESVVRDYSLDLFR